MNWKSSNLRTNITNNKWVDRLTLTLAAMATQSHKWNAIVLVSFFFRFVLSRCSGPFLSVFNCTPALINHTLHSFLRKSHNYYYYFRISQKSGSHHRECLGKRQRRWNDMLCTRPNAFGKVMHDKSHRPSAEVGEHEKKLPRKSKQCHLFHAFCVGCALGDEHSSHRF